ncbi:MAG: universal stress protein [Ferruginibacter sp.]|nr:universal stress protein [Ferruginibacter sp.]
MKTIIVATDFSSSALNAAIYAVNMAQLLEAEILLFNVFEVIPNYDEIVIDKNVDDLKKVSVKDMESFKHELIKLTNTNININTEVRLGIFIDEVNDICESIKPYMLIMGSQGKTAAERIIFGTHAGNALQKCSWPLITVPLTASFSAIKNIGIAYDFEKEIDKNLVAEIQLLANDFKADIHILNAAKEDEFNRDFVILSSKLEKMLSPNTIKFHFVAGEHINESIINYAEKNSIDLLVVMPKHRSLWEKFIGRSHTKQMVLHSHVPVLSLSK